MVGITTPFINTLFNELSNISEKGQYLADVLRDGGHVFPLHKIITVDGVPACPCGGGNGCKGPGKHPAWKWGTPLEPATAKTINFIRGRLHRNDDAGWGLHLGLSGLVTLDVDTKNGGLERWREMQERLGLTHLVPYAKTGGGGLHYRFIAPANCDPRRGWTGPDGATSTQIRFPNVGEFLSGQHYVVLPHSPHESGNHYELAGGPIYDTIPPVLVDEINAQLAESKKKKPTTGVFSHLIHRHCDPSTVDARALAYILTMERSIMGSGGSDRCFAVACALVEGFDIPPARALPIMLAWNDQRATPPWSEDELIHKLEDADARAGKRGYLLHAERKPRVDREFSHLDGIDIDFKIGGKFLFNTLDPWRMPDPEPITVPVTAMDFADIDWPERDEPEPTPEPAEPAEPIHGSACQRQTSILHFDPITRNLFDQLHPCKSHNCPDCAICHLEQRQATNRHYLGQLRDAAADGGAEPVYMAFCPHDQRETVTHRITRLGGRYIGVDRTGKGELGDRGILMVFTVRPLLPDVHAITHDEAIAKLNAELEATPLRFRRHSYYHSRKWPLIEDKSDGKKGLLFCGEVASTPEERAAVAGSYGIEPEGRKTSGRFFRYQTTRYNLGRRDWRHIVKEMAWGARYEKGTCPVTGRRDDDEDGFTSPADEPAPSGSLNLDFSTV